MASDKENTSNHIIRATTGGGFGLNWDAGIPSGTIRWSISRIISSPFRRVALLSLGDFINEKPRRLGWMVQAGAQVSKSEILQSSRNDFRASMIVKAYGTTTCAKLASTDDTPSLRRVICHLSLFRTGRMDEKMIFFETSPPTMFECDEVGGERSQRLSATRMPSSSSRPRGEQSRSSLSLEVRKRICWTVHSQLPRVMTQK